MRFFASCNRLHEHFREGSCRSMGYSWRINAAAAELVSNLHVDLFQLKAGSIILHFNFGIEQHLDRVVKSVSVLVHNNLALHDGLDNRDCSCLPDVFCVRLCVRPSERWQQRPHRVFDRTPCEWQRISMLAAMLHQLQETKNVQVQEVVRVHFHPLRQERRRMRDC